MQELVREFWGAILSLVAAMVWAIRLEGKTLQAEREIRRLWEQRKEDLDSAQRARSESLAMLHEIREDVKTLMSRESR